MDTNHKHIELYTDGACSGNPGPGGWCAILHYNSHERVLSGGERKTTNNRMELTAVIEGLVALKEPCEVTVFTDSEYVIGLMAQNWKRKANRDLIYELDVLCAVHDVEFQHVRGHAGHPVNEKCDTIAKRERDWWKTRKEVAR
jgi:ribonuclease HI